MRAACTQALRPRSMPARREIVPIAMAMYLEGQPHEQADPGVLRRASVRVRACWAGLTGSEATRNCGTVCIDAMQRFSIASCFNEEQTLSHTYVRRFCWPLPY